MAAIHINWKPTDRQLRQFSGIAVVGLPLVGWLFSGYPNPSNWQTWHTGLVGGLAGAGALLVLVSFIRPQFVKPIFLFATLLTFPIGMVLSEVILFLIYTIVFVPTALLFRIIKRDALDRTLLPDDETYWQLKKQSTDVRSYYRQS